MSEMNAVIGYLADEAAKAIGASVPSGPIEVKNRISEGKPAWGSLMAELPATFSS